MIKFFETAEKNKYQKCYNCKAMVELERGCNHMLVPPHSKSSSPCMPSLKLTTLAIPGPAIAEPSSATSAEASGSRVAVRGSTSRPRDQE